MRFIHLSDLHLGKRVNGFSMLEDQKDILDKIMTVIDSSKVQAVVIAGDIYDKSVPPTEAVRLFDGFLSRLARRQLKILVISGNHDSAERVAFGAELMKESGAYVSPVYDGTVTCVPLQDVYGTVKFHLLPFVKPAVVRGIFEDEEIGDYTDAVRAALSRCDLDETKRNVLVAHQFVTGAFRSESEEISVGGLDNVDASVFDAFDYVALGHIHGPQSIGRKTVRYCGTPLKYSFSEKDHLKSVTIVEMREKGDVSVETVPLIPLHDMRQIRGTYDELMMRSAYEDTDTEDYLHVVLTDEEDVPDAIAKMRMIYPNIMKLEYDNARTRNTQSVEDLDLSKQMTEEELFAAFYTLQNDRDMTQEQVQYTEDLFERLREENR
ncbi:MAG: exonuclease SbcCD subunit D [Clostridia bacterium]|nr:exonuclease SbcCD subunit D [Clostridia bacterium]MBR3196777.1 exonuclease SbcCD subunit D [Clostridia bacterium]